jgi:hypothetical protein
VKYLALTGLVSLTMAQASQYSNFWTWFQANEADFPTTSEFDATYGDELSGRLTDIKSGLVYEIAILDDAENELIISGDGIKELIPFVQDVVNSAPAIDGWKIIAFRPRMDDYASFTLNFGERNFDPKKLWCWSRIEDGSFDLVIYHAEYSDEVRNLLVNGTYVLLDMALGEYDVMTGIRYIDHRELPDDPEAAGLYNFEDLRTVFDEYKSTVTH